MQFEYQSANKIHFDYSIAWLVFASVAEVVLSLEELRYFVFMELILMHAEMKKKKWNTDALVWKLINFNKKILVKKCVIFKLI